MLADEDQVIGDGENNRGRLVDVEVTTGFEMIENVRTCRNDKVSYYSNCLF